MSSTETPHQTPLKDLNGFQRDLLSCVTRIGPAKGLEIREILSGEYGEEINHGRLYPNLNKLADAGLINKEAVDDRSNHYSVSRRGRTKLAARIEWTLTCMEADDE